MAKLVWDVDGSRLYETGVSNCALYVWDSDSNGYGEGVAWSGISSITESPSGADSNPIYADNIKYLDLRSAEDFGATIEAYMYPDEWMECDGTAQLTDGVYFGQQARKKFCLAYKTILGNDTDNDDHGYKLHLVYGATASPSERQYQTKNDSPEANTFSWEVNTAPIKFTHNGKEYSTSTIVIDSTKCKTSEKAAKLAAVERTLFGDSDVDPSIMMPNEIYTALDA